MILKRKIYAKLLAWKEECNGNRALLVEGARRIGKSTICEEFGKNEYETCLVIDFAKQDKDVEADNKTIQISKNGCGVISKEII